MYADTFIEHWLSSSWNKLQPGERSPWATMFNYIWLIKDMNEVLDVWSLSSALWPALIGFLTPMRGINRFISKEAEGLSFPYSASIADCNYRVEVESSRKKWLSQFHYKCAIVSPATVVISFETSVQAFVSRPGVDHIYFWRTDILSIIPMRHHFVQRKSSKICGINHKN